MNDLQEMASRTYIAEPARGQRVWASNKVNEEDAARLKGAQSAPYANRKGSKAIAAGG